MSWQRSRFCDTGHCVEVARTSDGILMRNSTAPDGPFLTFSLEEWKAFIAGVIDGELRLDE
jgi:hypothetical protein